ncbi:hypothetical protein DM02DRAFT_337054 [Periconia macrospinosa]|uniref:Uncharacterized protein n=1 Tax=Periconia macrospinosa TaxID=97972 RepID=A0A2V1DUL8_9PLEO|nr:hypothetical protein DM02DRAFT_337054 [Periconia macrospinosa]
MLRTPLLRMRPAQAPTCSAPLRLDLSCLLSVISLLHSAPEISDLHNLVYCAVDLCREEGFLQSGKVSFICARSLRHIVVCLLPEVSI